jgi:glutamate-1-semialdehyde 2,1-aminomutase
VRFLKSGAEAVAAAVRIARTCTGRDLVVGSGYFGWLDWWSEAAGVPAGAHADFVAVPFDDVAALEAAVAAAGTRLAAVVLEPVQERLPSAAWARRARELCDAAGAALVFDDMKIGFRLRTAGYQAVGDVRPDLAVFGKALANGFPLAAVVGRRDVMDAARRTWISSTLAGENAALAAAAAVLDRHEREDVCARIAAVGERQLDVARAAVADAGLGDEVGIAGIAPMWFLRHADAAAETRTLQALVRRGVLLKRGAYNFSSPAHDEAALARLADALPAALREGYRR